MRIRQASATDPAGNSAPAKPPPTDPPDGLAGKGAGPPPPAGADGELPDGGPAVGPVPPGRNTRFVMVPLRVNARISAVRNLLTKIVSPSTTTSRRSGSIVRTCTDGPDAAGSVTSSPVAHATRI